MDFLSNLLFLARWSKSKWMGRTHCSACYFPQRTQ